MTKHKTITEALVAFQADLPAVTLDGDNPHFKSKFATLANMTNIVLPKLSEHGLAFSTGSYVENGLLILDAHLLHESGESRSMAFPIAETNPQKVGSAISYYRRYGLAALTGVVADHDDDGNAASNPSPAERQIANARTPKAPAKPNSGPSAQDKIREWIGSDADKRKKVQELDSKYKAEKLTGNSLFEAIATELGV